jgi:hypothetical protein
MAEFSGGCARMNAAYLAPVANLFAGIASGVKMSTYLMPPGDRPGGLSYSFFFTGGSSTVSNVISESAEYFR